MIGRDLGLTTIEKKFFEKCNPIIEAEGLETYDLSYVQGSTTLKIFIQNPVTKTALIEDCVRVDHALDVVFAEDWVPDSIVLEVSSPGVFRQLKTKRHFEQAQGEWIAVTLNEEIEYAAAGKAKKMRNFRAKLIGLTEEELKFQVEDAQLNINANKIKKATLDPEI